jgi:hypothetical protein
MTRKTYTDAEVWADPRSRLILDTINLSRNLLGRYLLAPGDPRAAAAVRLRLELDDAEKRERERKRIRRAKLQ